MVSPLPSRTQVTLTLTLVVILVIYYIVRSTTSKVTQSVESSADTLIKPAADTIADVSMWVNGSEKIEFQPLIVEEWYLNDDYTLTSEAERVLWKTGDYHQVLYRLFGGRGRPMKSQYRHLIGVPVTENSF